MDYENCTKEELIRYCKIKDAWNHMIVDSGFDYDGYMDTMSLKSLIDELVVYASRSIRCNDTDPVYTSLKSSTDYNILFEKIVG